MSANSKSIHGHPFSSLHPKSETVPVGNRLVATRSTRQPRLSFSAFPPSSDNDYPKRQLIPPQKEEVPLSTEEPDEDDDAEEVKRTWNLRPRKACGGGGASEGNNHKSGESKSNRQRGIPAESPGLGGVEVANENIRLWIALSRDEIEEDLFSMSGNRPSRRPRKRTKTLQKYLDVISPGLCLVGMNADCFRVSNSLAKR